MSMKILFICTDNNGRSVIAEYSFKQYATNNEIADVDTSSCGTDADSDLTGFSFAHFDELKKLGIDASGHKRTQLTKEMLVDADRVIVFDHEQQKYLKENFGCEAELFDSICFDRETDVTFSGFGKSKDENAIALTHYIYDAIPTLSEAVISREGASELTEEHHGIK